MTVAVVHLPSIRGTAHAHQPPTLTWLLLHPRQGPPSAWLPRWVLPKLPSPMRPPLALLLRNGVFPGISPSVDSLYDNLSHRWDPWLSCAAPRRGLPLSQRHSSVSSSHKPPSWLLFPGELLPFLTPLLGLLSSWWAPMVKNLTLRRRCSSHVELPHATHSSFR
jgi:hypothetical protein